MLVLTRTANESVVINGEITVKVIAVRGKRVRLGFEAPREVVVLRSELPQRINVPPAGDHPVCRADG